jgi:argininosuccinate synthase
VNNQRIVLAFNGHPASCAAVRWLAGQHSADVIALIVDVGQGDDPEEVYARAFACGASNVHVVDRCDVFARRSIVPAIASPVSLDADALRRLPYPVIAAALVEVAAIEDAVTVAHASTDETLDAEIRALAPALRVLAPARELMHDRSGEPGHRDRHLLIRRARTVGTLGTSGTLETATVTIEFEAGVPRSVNGVAMELPELIESLSLIGGQYHVDHENAAPALVLLQRAYRECAGNGAATLNFHVASANLHVASANLHVASAFRRKEAP